jgi:hypothetical protein
MNFVRVGKYLINLNQVAYIHVEARAVHFSALTVDEYLQIFLQEDELEEMISLIQKLPMRTTMV